MIGGHNIRKIRTTDIEGDRYSSIKIKLGAGEMVQQLKVLVLQV